VVYTQLTVVGRRFEARPVSSHSQDKGTELVDIWHMLVVVSHNGSFDLFIA
jgi:hypothetical protein